MNSGSSGRNQKPKGLKVKPAFQFALLLAVCFWLLYQMKQSHGKDYRKEHGSDILGRKENAGWSKGGGISISEDANLAGESMKKEEGGGGDDVLDGISEEKNEEESIHEVNDHAHGNLGSHEGNEIEKETEMQHKELVNTEDNSDIEVRGKEEAGGLNESSLQEGDPREGHEGTQAIITDQDGEKDVKNMSHDEVGEDKEQKSQVFHENIEKHEIEKDREKESQRLEELSTNKDITVWQSESKNDTLHGSNSVVDGVVHGFEDETGVPLDGNDLVESMVTGASGDRAIIAHQDMNSSSSNQSETNESTVNEEVASKEGTNGADLEAKSKIPVEDTKIDIKPKVEIKSGIGAHEDT